MLQLQTKSFDICRISKLLAKYNIKASISNQYIILDSMVPDELLSELCNNIKICKVNNFCKDISDIDQNEPVTSETDKLVSSTFQDEVIRQKTEQKLIIEPRITKNYDLIYPNVQRGDVYLCDFGIPFGHEQGYERYAIVLQNDIGNANSDNTIVLAFTSQEKHDLPTHYNFEFSDENMFNFIGTADKFKPTTALGEIINTFDKRRLRKYIGTMKPSFMDKMQEIVDVSLGAKRSEKIKTKIVYGGKVVIKTRTNTVYKERVVFRNNPDNQPVCHEPQYERKDLSMMQLQILSRIDVNDLFKIANTNSADNVKLEKIFELFGFDMKQNGVQYLFNAIIHSPKNKYFNLETLCKKISKNEPDIVSSEIERLIVARTKEHFGFKKSPAIDFIRLINLFLSKKEELQNEKDNI